MFGSGGQGSQQHGGFGSVQGRGFGQASGFGTGGAGPVKWGGGSKAAAAEAKPPGGALFGQPTQRPSSAPHVGRGGGRSGGRGAQQASSMNRGWQGNRTLPAGRGRGSPVQPQQQQQQQQSSPGVLQRIGSLVGSPWGKGQPQQQQQMGAEFATPARASAAAAAAIAGSRGGWPDRGRGRTGGRQQAGGRQQPQQWGSRGGRPQQPPSQHPWSRQQQQGQPAVRGRGGGRGSGSSSSSSRGRGGGRGPTGGNQGGVFSRLGPMQGNKGASAAAAVDEEEMVPAEEHDWQELGGTAADGQAGDEAAEEWGFHEEEMVDMEADDWYEGGVDDGQQYGGDNDGHPEEEAEEEHDAADGVMTAEEIEAAQQAAVAAVPRFIGGMEGSSKVRGAGFGTVSAAPASPAPAATAPRPVISYLQGAAAGTPSSTPTVYDQLQASPSRPDVHKRMAVAAEGGLNIDPQCDDMCPRAEREQRTADRQLHEFERVAGDYRTDAGHAVKKYTRSEAGGLPNPVLLRTFEALKKTLIHLRGLMCRVGDGSSGTCTLLEAHRFLWDRYRSMRKDITQTELIHKGDNQLRWVIAANEEMARFMILADAFLADKDKINYDVKKAKAGSAIEFDMDQFQADAEAAAAERAAAGMANFEPDPYDGHLNHQELSKTLLDLSALYREAHRVEVSCPNEAEFLSYYLIVSRGTFGSFKQSTANFVRLLNQMNPEVAGSPYIQYALELSGCLAATNYVAFMKLLEGAPLHLAAAGQIYVPRMRSIGLCCMLQSAPPTSRRVKQVPLQLFATLLGFDSPQQAQQFASKHKSAQCPDLVVHTDASEEQMLEVSNSSLSHLRVLKEPPRHCLPWILSKTAGAGLGDLVSQPCPLPDMIRIRAKGRAAVRLIAARPAAARQQAPKPAAVTPQLQQQPAPASVQQHRRAAAAGEKFGAAGVQQQQQMRAVPLGGGAGNAQGLGFQAVNARGSAGYLPAMMAPAEAAKGAADVFGSLSGAEKPATAGALWPQQLPAPAAARVPVQPVQQHVLQATPQLQKPVQAQQQQQPGAGYNQSVGSHAPQQPALAPQAALQQQQHVQQQQQQQAAVAAALAAERARYAAREQAVKAALDEKEAEIKRLRKSETELRLLKQERELREKCDDAGRRLWFDTWSKAAAAAKQARLRHERQSAALAAADATLGRVGGSKRTLAVAGAGVEAAGLIDWERQEKRVRGDLDAYESDLLDLAPVDAAVIIADALAPAAAGEYGAAAQQPALVFNRVPLQLPSMASRRHSSSRSILELLPLGGHSKQGAMIDCPAAQLHYKLLVVSGWRETDNDDVAPPLFQRRVANWLRHKLARYLAIVSDVSSSSSSLAVQLAYPTLVPLAASSATEQQQSHSRSWAAVVSGGGSAAQNGSRQPFSVRQVWRFGGSEGAADLLLLQHMQLPGTSKGDRQKQLEIMVQAVDITSSKLTAAAETDQTGAAEHSLACVGGAAGVLLLVSGPDEQELSSAVTRLARLLEVLPSSPSIPLVVMTCSGSSSKPDVEAGLRSLISTLPTHLAAKLNGGEVVCAGPGTNLQNALKTALQAAVVRAPQLPRLREVPAAGLLEALLVMSLGPADDAGPEEQADGLLQVHVAAHNRAVHQMGELLQQQLESEAYQWGYPPVGKGSSGSRQLRNLLPQLQLLLLPDPPPFQQQQQQHVHGIRGDGLAEMAAGAGFGGCVLLQLVAYLHCLCQGAGSAAAAAAAAGEVLVLLQHEMGQVAHASGVPRSINNSQQQQQLSNTVLQLVVAAMELLLKLLQATLSETGNLLIDEDVVHSLMCSWQQQLQKRQLAALQLQSHSRPYAPRSAPPAAGAKTSAVGVQVAVQHSEHGAHELHLLTPQSTAGRVVSAAGLATPSFAGMTAFSPAPASAADHAQFATPVAASNGFAAGLSSNVQQQQASSIPAESLKQLLCGFDTAAANVELQGYAARFGISLH